MKLVKTCPFEVSKARPPKNENFVVLKGIVVWFVRMEFFFLVVCVWFLRTEFRVRVCVWFLGSGFISHCQYEVCLKLVINVQVFEVVKKKSKLRLF